jgi:hypothetical protein
MSRKPAAAEVDAQPVVTTRTAAHAKRATLHFETMSADATRAASERNPTMPMTRS